jgi:hypothetical protein
VTNSFGEEKFHAANGKAQASTQGAFLFFPFKFWGGEEDLKKIPLVPMCSHYVPNEFTSGFQCVPQHVLHSTSLWSHVLGKMLSSIHLYRWAKGGGTLDFKIEPSILGSLNSFIFLLSDGPIKLAHCKKNKK